MADKTLTDLQGRILYLLCRPTVRSGGVPHAALCDDLRARSAGHVTRALNQLDAARLVTRGGSYRYYLPTEAGRAALARAAEHALGESARCLANANEERAAGRAAHAATWDALAQKWLDRRNALAGDGEPSAARAAP